METEFNKKIDHFAGHPKYGWLRKYADEALKWNTMCGLYQIKAEDFMKRIVGASLDYIQNWLDGRNGIEWHHLAGPFASSERAAPAACVLVKHFFFHHDGNWPGYGGAAARHRPSWRACARRLSF